MADVKENKNPQGFYFNQQALHRLPYVPGGLQRQEMIRGRLSVPPEWKASKWENFQARHFPLPGACNHCHTLACAEVCLAGATYINEEDGTVQHDDEACIGCGYCVKACPYGHLVLIEELNVVHRCDGCIDLRAAGEKPACVAACPMRALDFGPIEELRAAHPDGVNVVSVLPSRQLILRWLSMPVNRLFPASRSSSFCSHLPAEPGRATPPPVARPGFPRYTGRRWKGGAPMKLKTKFSLPDRRAAGGVARCEPGLDFRKQACPNGKRVAEQARALAQQMDAVWGIHGGQSRPPGPSGFTEDGVYQRASLRHCWSHHRSVFHDAFRLHDAVREFQSAQ